MSDFHKIAAYIADDLQIELDFALEFRHAPYLTDIGFGTTGVTKTPFDDNGIIQIERVAIALQQIDKEYVVKILLHELRHVQQIKHGRLNRFGTNTKYYTTWDGNHFSQNYPYHQQPWEVDACGYEFSAYDRLFASAFKFSHSSKWSVHDVIIGTIKKY